MHITKHKEESILTRRLKWVLPFFASLLPIVLLSLYSFQIASQSVQALVEADNYTETTNLAQLLSNDFAQSVSVAHAMASIDKTVEAVRKKDTLTIGSRLKTIVLSYPQIDRAFVTDRLGVLWSDFPSVRSQYGKSLASQDWYTGLSSRWKPYISRVYLREADPQYPVVAVAVPIFDPNQHVVIGALVFEYPVKNILRWLQNVRLAISGHLYVVDHTGTIVAHPDIKADGSMLDTTYKSVPLVQQAIQGKYATKIYTDPRVKKSMIATFLPTSIGRNRWAVVAQQPVDEAFELLERVKWNLSIVGSILTLLTLTMVVALARMSARNLRLNRELGTRNEQLRDFASVVSHQLKAPITGIRWTLESVLDGDFGPLTEEQKGMIRQVHEIAGQNYDLITHILNMSRLERGVITVDMHPVLLRDVVERAVRDYRVPMEQKGLRLDLLGVELPILVLADKEKMAEAVSNSISNAIKHTAKGGITIHISQEGTFGIVTVTDTGGGIPPDILKKLFTRDQILGGSASPEQSAGLGLYIAKNFMELQKGDIDVTSEMGKGTKFTYRVPLAKSSNSTDPS